MAHSFSPTTYPHLWDHIIANADRKTQHTLRRVDAQLRAAVDQHQARHLVLIPEGIYSLKVTGPEGKIAAFMERPQFWKDQRLLDLLPYTRVVDVRGFCPPTIDLPHLATGFRNLEVVRMSPDATGASTPYVPWPARTLVLFASFAGFWVNDRHWWWDKETKLDPNWEAKNLTVPHGRRPMVPPGVDQYALFDTFERIVLNFNGDLSSLEEIRPLFRNLPRTVKEVLLVLPRNKSLDDSGTLFSFYAGLEMSFHALTRAQHAKYTFVGFDLAKPGYNDELRDKLRQWKKTELFIDVDYGISCADTADLRKRERYVAASEQARANGVLEGKPVEVPAQLVDLTTKVDQLMANMEFITQAQYRKCVDSEVASLETLEFFREDEYE
ncbi:hypothetical protein A1Q1_03263 [Trichosporon asahii var. asahii CBS 2479]|uniref:Uncharacterized protein n=1 Tax=Trichosporon asahii var. asahii (strain ATCC 90039 / CBS 2479 / JCM 2466 / KCTC 7840 / NBRC 103889/ NCYC 2677 / UAMH 7654) TaxID=1186058 RepID=J6EY82_TRIAS|nr:hypothetical protein A1Q1_03263 [Trichosporon asahii var. asahii CBS 2479]EJT47802.1 hypothetical protein A1Q1_03263 [Trichosporon asahii var. asahii CBS 2479]